MTLSTQRRSGQPFPDFAVETYAQERASMKPIGLAARGAGISMDGGKRLEKDPAVQARIAELREGTRTYTTVSREWCLEQLRINATEAREGRSYTAIGKDGSPVEVDAKPDYKASNEALKLILEVLDSDAPVLTTGIALPANATPQAIRGAILAELEKNDAEAPPEAAQ